MVTIPSLPLLGRKALVVDPALINTDEITFVVNVQSNACAFRRVC